MPKWPIGFVHHGLNYVKVMEELPGNKKILGYECVNFPTLGTSRHIVSTWLPKDGYLQEVMGTIRCSISQFIAEYVRAIETLRELGDKTTARDLQVFEPIAEPYNPMVEEWPEVLNHHGIFYWRKMESLPNGDTMLIYDCREFKRLGQVRVKVESSRPNPTYKQAVISCIIYHINQYLTDYFIFTENARKRRGEEALFTHADVGIQNQWEEAEVRADGK